MNQLVSRKNLFGVYMAASTALASYAVYKALWNRPNLYSAGIELSKGANLIILTNWLICWSITLGKLFQEMMFGELRLIEIEHLYERAWFTVTNLLMTLAMFRSENNLLIIGMILSLLFMKIFHWILGDRLDFLFQQQQMSTGDSNIRQMLFNRTTAVLALFLVLDYRVISGCVDHAFMHSTDVFVVFGLDFLMVYLELLECTLTYILNLGELLYLRYYPEEEVWEDKVWISKIGMIIISIFRLLAVAFVFVGLIYAYIIPVNFTRDLYVGIYKLVNQIKDFFYLIKASRDLDTHITNATAADLTDQEMCIICRDDMSADIANKHSRKAPKKLPCGHVLHFGCLKSWLERSHCCPTCRREVFSDGALPEWSHHHEGEENERDDAANTNNDSNEATNEATNEPMNENTNENTNETTNADRNPTSGVNTNAANTTNHSATANNSNFSLTVAGGTTLPPDWTVLPLRRQPEGYEVRLNSDYSCQMRIIKREKPLSSEEFENYMVQN